MTDRATLGRVQVGQADINSYRALLDGRAWTELERAMRELASRLRGRTVWNVNSTARGGGVAELLSSLIPYERGSGIDERWLTIDGAPAYFDVTKKIHTFLHGVASDGSEISRSERNEYERTMARNATALVDTVKGNDVVILHDPQSAGLVSALHAHGTHVIWRSHVGLDQPNDIARAAWDMLRPYLDEAEAYVFSRRNYVWEGLDDSRGHIRRRRSRAAGGAGRARDQAHRPASGDQGPGAHRAAPDGGRGRERDSRQRAPEACDRRGAEEPRRGLRPDGGRGDVEGAPRGGESGRRYRGSDRERAERDPDRTRRPGAVWKRGRRPA